MFNCKLNLRRGLSFVVLIAAAISATTASATSGRASNMDNICAAAGNDMIVPAPLVDNCTSCHDDGSGGGSGEGRDVYKDGTDAERLAFFCPTIDVPPQTCTDMDGDGISIEGGLWSGSVEFHSGCTEKSRAGICY